MKIAVITPRFAFSGVPLAQIRLAQSLSNRGHAVDLLIGNIPNTKDLPKLNNINLINFQTMKVRNMLWHITRYFFQSKPDIVFSAEDHLNILVIISRALAQSKAKLSCSSRVTPYDTFSNKILSKRWILKILYSLLQNRADVSSCVSRGMVEQYKKIFKNSRHQPIYNIIDPVLSKNLINEPIDDPDFNIRDLPILIAAGTLAHWKGFDLLIEAVKILSSSYEFKLFILGDGPDRDLLTSMIKEYELENVITLKGRVNNTLKYFKASDIFILSSRVEGMPNVLVEAMMCGCTPVSFDCETGPNEIILNNDYGYLAQPKCAKSLSEAIAKALDRRISDEKLNERVKLFSEGSVLKKHFDALGIRS